MAAPFVDYLARRLPLVERALADSAGAPLTDSAVASDLGRYLYSPLEGFTASGGKRVRPVLALLGAEAVGGRAEDALSVAVAVELFQSAALIHDDIADESELRRGEPCLYRTAGTGLAINAGDLALTRVFEVVLADESLDPERKVRALAELVRMERHTLEGQALDLGWVHDGRWDVSPDDYLYMVTSKTSWYTVASPLCLGALVGGGSDEAARGLLDLGISAALPSSCRRPAQPGGRRRRAGQGLPLGRHRGQAHARPWSGPSSTLMPRRTASSLPFLTSRRRTRTSSRAPSSSSSWAAASRGAVSWPAPRRARQDARGEARRGGSHAPLSLATC